MNSPTPLIRFTCSCCQTSLTVPQSMAGVTGPCPTCQAPITAPLPPTAPEVPVATTPVDENPARRGHGRLVGSLAAVAIVAAVGFWTLKMRSAVDGNAQADTTPLPPPASRAEAIERNSAMVRHFLASATWPEARPLVATQDITGTLAEPAFQPERFQPLAQNGTFTPEQVEEIGAPYQMRIVWNIQSAHEASRLTLISEDTPDGPRVRWHQPPAFLSVVGGTNATLPPAATAPQISEPAPMPPTPPSTPRLDAVAATTLLAAAQKAAPQSSAPLVQPATEPSPNPPATAAVPRAKVAAP